METTVSKSKNIVSPVLYNEISLFAHPCLYRSLNTNLDKQIQLFINN